MNSQKVSSSLLTISQSWPKDYLRPSLQFKDAIRAAHDRIFYPSTSTSTSTATPTPPTLSTLSPQDLIKAEEMAASLQRLLVNSAFKQYPLSDRTLKPASYPRHYTRLQQGVEKAKRGEYEKPKWFSWIRWK